MEAPEKIFYAPYGDMREDAPITDNDIEYTRTDVFIEKMFNFLSEKYLIKTKEPLRWVPIRQVIEDFKKYMEK